MNKSVVLPLAALPEFAMIPAMRGDDFVHSLGGERVPGMAGLLFKVPNWSLSQIRDKAGSDGELRLTNSTVVIQFPFDDGSAIVFGEATIDNALEKTQVIVKHN